MISSITYKLFFVFMLIGITSCGQPDKKAIIKKEPIMLMQNHESIARSIDSAQRELKKQEREAAARETFVRDSVLYASETPISVQEANELKPALKKWLDFYDIDISLFKLVQVDSISRDYFITPEDTASLYYREFDDNFEGVYTPQSRDYSPNKRRYINLLETTLVYKSEEDGKWYYDGSDDCQEIRLVDLDRRTDKMFLFTGTSFMEGALWKNNDCFILAQYDYNDDYNDDEYKILVYDLFSPFKKIYRQKKTAPSDKFYSEYNMKKRGIIVR